MQEPQDFRNIELNPSIVDNLKNMTITPVTLRKMFLLLTRMHYSTPANFGVMAEKYAKYVWDESDRPKLFIDLDYHYRPNDNDHRPAIFVGCADHLYAQTVMDGKAGHSPDGAAEHYYNQGSTQVVIRHIGKTADESMDLGDMTSMFYRGIRKVMQNEVGWNKYVVAKLASGRPFDKRPEQADQQFVSDLVIDLGFNVNWSIWTESHRLKDADWATLVRVAGKTNVAWTKVPGQ